MQLQVHTIFRVNISSADMCSSILRVSACCNAESDAVFEPFDVAIGDGADHVVAEHVPVR